MTYKAVSALAALSSLIGVYGPFWSRVETFGEPTYFGLIWSVSSGEVQANGLEGSLAARLTLDNTVDPNKVDPLGLSQVIAAGLGALLLLVALVFAALNKSNIKTSLLGGILCLGSAIFFVLNVMVFSEGPIPDQIKDCSALDICSGVGGVDLFGVIIEPFFAGFFLTGIAGILGFVSAFLANKEFKNVDQYGTAVGTAY
mmetsp:Transcript_13564/g.29967  ORF Transcript_13564/g.29967 Transcript_13564/m.29967 type:complete len:200 (-) Transcript_13564:30-629(-)